MLIAVSQRNKKLEKDRDTIWLLAERSSVTSGTDQ